jgi:glycosyltransferase Alg8
VIKNVVNAEVKQVDLITRGRPLILDQTEDILVEYVTVRGTMTAPVDLQQPYDSPVVDDDSFVMKE